MKFLHSVVRFVPDNARGEFVNVGVIVVPALTAPASTDRLEFRCVSDFKRARAIDDRRSLGNVHEFFEDLARQPRAGFDADRLFVMHASMHNAIQLTSPLPVLADSAGTALDLVWGDLVAEVKTSRAAYTPRTSAVAHMRHSYREAFAADGSPVVEKARVMVGSHALRVDHDVANGKVLEITHAFSFQIPKAEDLVDRVRSWGFVVQQLRSDGGRLLLEKRQVEVGRNVDINVINIPPIDGPAESVYEEAQSVFKQVRASQHDWNSTDEVAEDALSKYAASTAKR